jgi:hypothetical protein
VHHLKPMLPKEIFLPDPESIPDTLLAEWVELMSQL